MDTFNLDNIMSLDEVTGFIEILKKEDLPTVLMELKNLAEILNIGGVSDFSPSVSVDIIVDYVYNTIDTLLHAEEDEIDYILDSLILKIDSANNDSKESKKINRKDNKMSEATVVLYNPTFDPGHDTSTCVEIDGKVAGLAFSVKGIQSILQSNDMVVTADDIIEQAAVNNVVIAEDSDEVFTPIQYADALEDAYSSKLDETVHKNSNITYRKLISGYRRLGTQKYAENERFNTKTDSELRRMLLDTWLLSERPAEFDRDKLNYMTRDEVIEAIKAQETQPIRSEASVDDIMESYKEMTIGDVMDFVQKKGADYDGSDLFSEEILMEDDYFGNKSNLVDENGAPVESSLESITDHMITGGSLETRDGSKGIYSDGAGYMVVAEDLGYEEFFAENELDEAVELFQELIASESLTTDLVEDDDMGLSMASKEAAKPGEIVDFSMPTQEEFQEAKDILDREMKKRQALNKALSEYTQKIREELGFTSESEAEFQRAAEVVLKKIRNFKRGYEKLSEEFNARVAEMKTGGSPSKPILRELLAEKYGLEIKKIRELEKLAVTPEFTKEVLTLEDRETGQKTPIPQPFILKEKSSADARLTELNRVSEILDNLMNIQQEYLWKIENLDEAQDVAASRK